MKKRLRAWRATARMCLKEKSYFGLANIVAQYLLRAAGLGAMLMIWRSLFMQGAYMQGLTLNQVCVYTILSTVLAPMLDVRTPASGWLHDGSLLGLYLRPRGLFAQLAAHTVGGWALPLAVLSLPVTGVALLCGVDLRPASFWFLPSLALTVSLGFAVDYLFACLLIRLNNLEWVVHDMRQSLTALFSGSVIPFAALPWGLGRVLALTPLGALAGGPLSLYVGLADPVTILGAQLFWNAVLWPLALWRFSVMRERMVSYGG
jgi:ABC-2 type transport system permease protein